MSLAAFNAFDEFSETAASGKFRGQGISTSNFLLGPLAELIVFLNPLQPRKNSIPLRYDCEQGQLFNRCLSSAESVYFSAAGMGILRLEPAYIDSDVLATNSFILNLRQLLGQTGMPSAAAQTFSGVAGELIDNIAVHAGRPQLSFAAFNIHRGDAWIAVADAGHGVLGGYAMDRSLPQPEDAQEALQWAVIEHQSRFSDSKRGLGYRRALSALRSLDASMRVRSDSAGLEMRGGVNRDDWLLREQVYLGGFVVSVHVAW
jgi:hypothetical protein